MSKKNTIHVFIDTNVFLEFFDSSSEDVDLLNGVFSKYEHGSATIYLTGQVHDEFIRNREYRIQSALIKFVSPTVDFKIPEFMTKYIECEKMKNICKEFNREFKKNYDSILHQANEDIREENLSADKVINEIFTKSNITREGNSLYEEARMRMDIGNPPGKKGSMGDAMNWVHLLKNVPQEQDIHIVSHDGDFYSVLNSNKNENVPNPYLLKEWQDQKQAELFVYRKLSQLTEKHFDGVAFTFDSNKEKLISDLENSMYYADTHLAVAGLNDFSYFSFNDMSRILSAAYSNNQISSIVTDEDIVSFIRKIVGPHLGKIANFHHKDVLEKINIKYD